MRNEQSRATVDMSSVDSRMKGEYEAMLKRELKSLRKLYKASMKQSQEEFMRTYNQKVSHHVCSPEVEENESLSLLIILLLSCLTWSEPWPRRRVTTAAPWWRPRS